MSDKPKTVSSTRFSDFIRNASSAERKQVYKDVLVRATERQKRLIAEAEAAMAKSAELNLTQTK